MKNRSEYKPCPCQICNKSSAHTLSCPYCDYTTCSSCTQRYILDSVYDAHCMSCRKPWTYSFLESSLPKTFLKKEYRSKQENLLFEREKSYIPQTRRMVMYQEQIKQHEETAKQIRHSIHELEKKYQSEMNCIQVIQKKMCQPTQTSIPCSSSSCMGVIENGYCMLCNTSVCTKCKMVESESHVCKEEDLQSVLYIEETSKPCPNCKAMIQRSSGCDHMWCTSCHVPFKWSTLSIEKHVSPNPHYYEYLAKTATTLCQDTLLLDQRYFILVEQRIASLHCSTEEKEHILRRLKYVIRLREVDYIEFQQSDDEWTHHDLRIRYIRNDITEERFKSLLYIAHTKIRHHQEYMNILTTYLTIMSDWLRSIDDDSVTLFIENEGQLQSYLNTTITHLRQFCTRFTLLTL